MWRLGVTRPVLPCCHRYCCSESSMLWCCRRSSDVERRRRASPASPRRAAGYPCRVAMGLQVLYIKSFTVTRKQHKLRNSCSLFYLQDFCSKYCTMYSVSSNHYVPSTDASSPSLDCHRRVFLASFSLASCPFPYPFPCHDQNWSRVPQSMNRTRTVAPQLAP